MSIEIKKIKLNKEEFIFGIDKEIELSFELFSNNDENIKELNILYGYNFYGKNQKHNAFQGKFEEKNINIDGNYGKKFSYKIPIKFFNLNKISNFSNIEIKNYIKIKINNGLFSKNILEEINPIIKFDTSLYGIKNLFINNENEIESGENNINEIEKLILKTDEEKYEKIILEIKNIEKEINKIENENEENHNEEIENLKLSNILDDLYKKRENLFNEKEKLFLIKENEKNNFEQLKKEETEIVKEFEKLEGEDVEKFLTLSNKLQKIQYKIYETYLNKDENNYKNLLKTFFSGINEENNENSELNHITEKINISGEIKKNNSDYISIKKHFKGIIYGNFYETIEENSLSADYVHKEIFEKLKGNLIINIFTKLVNSKIFNFIYKYIFILPFIGLLLVIFENYVNKYIKFDFTFTLIFYIFPLVFIILAKIFESIFQNSMNKAIYDYKLNNSTKIKENIENKLISGRLNISDIFEKLQLKIDSNLIDYNFKVSLVLNVGTYYTEGKNTHYENITVYTIDLFNSVGKGNFNLNNVKLLENNYENLKNILVNSDKNDATKIYYSIVYNFDSSYLPDLEGKIDLFLNFSNKKQN